MMATIGLVFGVLPIVLTLGFLHLNDNTQNTACRAVHQSNVETIRFLRERVPQDGQDDVTALARVYDDVYAKCLKGDTSGTP